MLLDAIVYAHGLLAEEARPVDVFAGLLDVLLKLTDSEYGFIGEILETEAGAPYVKAYAITNIAWNEEMQRLYAEQAQEGIEFTNLETLFGAVVTTGKPVISNDPANDPRSGGTPSGHPPLKRFLGLPLRTQNSLFGIAGVANRERPYDELIIAFLKPFLATCSNILLSFRNARERQRIESALRMSQKALSEIFASGRDAMYETDESGAFRVVNPAVTAITGYDEAELLGTHYLDLVRADYRESAEQLYGDQYTQRTLHSYFEFPINAKGGREVWVGQHVGLISEGDGVTGFQAVARDITDRHMAEQAIADREARIRAILESSRDPIITIDEGGVIESANRATEATFGYLVDELVGQNVQMLMPEPYRHEHAAYVKRYLETGEPHVIGLGREVTAQRKDGTSFPIALSIGEVQLNGTRLFTGIIRDITEQKAAEEQVQQALFELQASHDALNATLDQLRVGSLIISADGRVLFLSDVVEDLEGIVPATALGQPWERVLPFPHEAKEQIRQLAALPSHRRSRLEVEWRAAGDLHYFLEIEVADDPRDPAQRIFFLYDVSSAHSVKQQLDRARFGKIIGNSPVMRRVFELFQEVAKADLTVLIEGETGVGKELVARGIHTASPRHRAPFIPVNCAGLTETLVNSQLFGHRRGAFTGAVTDQKGVFEAAGEGTVFLDEIGDIPPSVQTSLLRVLEENEITRVGDSKPQKIKARIVAATHRNLQEEVAKGQFRKDLLYRIRVARIQVPPLRKRRGDIPLLVASFLAENRVATGKALSEVCREAMQVLERYPWPGNVRELKNALSYAAVHCKSSVLRLQDFPEEITRWARTARLPAIPQVADPSGHAPSGYAPSAGLADAEARSQSLESERERILVALERTGGNRSRAAKELGISRATLYRRLTAFGIS
jgi:PAS domain S-box-containing protein